MSTINSHYPSETIYYAGPDQFVNLPSDPFFKIFSYLDETGLSRANLVSRRWHFVASVSNLHHIVAFCEHIRITRLQSNSLLPLSNPRCLTSFQQNLDEIKHFNHNTTKIFYNILSHIPFAELIRLANSNDIVFPFGVPNFIKKFCAYSQIKCKDECKVALYASLGAIEKALESTYTLKGLTSYKENLFERTVTDLLNWNKDEYALDYVIGIKEPIEREHNFYIMAMEYLKKDSLVESFSFIERIENPLIHNVALRDYIEKRYLNDSIPLEVLISELSVTKDENFFLEGRLETLFHKCILARFYKKAIEICATLSSETKILCLETTATYILIEEYGKPKDLARWLLEKYEALMLIASVATMTTQLNKKFDDFAIHLYKNEKMGLAQNIAEKITIRKNSRYWKFMKGHSTSRP